jgi:hypothetical protein
MSIATIARGPPTNPTEGKPLLKKLGPTRGNSRNKGADKKTILTDSYYFAALLSHIRPQDLGDLTAYMQAQWPLRHLYSGASGMKI